jgi:hypothetical protein
MARRKPKYPNPTYVPSDDARRRIAVLMEPKQREKLKLRIQEDWQPRGGWQLWRWDTLEDVQFS